MYPYSLHIYLLPLIFYSLSLPPPLYLSPEIPLANTLWRSFRTATCTFLFVLDSYIHTCTFLFVHRSRTSNMCPCIDLIVTAVAVTGHRTLIRCASVATRIKIKTVDITFVHNILQCTLPFVVSKAKSIPRVHNIWYLRCM